MLTVALLTFAATNVVSFWLPDFWTLAAARVVMAAAPGVTVVTALCLVRHVFPPEWHGRGLATVQMGFTAALVLGIPAGRFIADTAGWRTTFSSSPASASWLRSWCAVVPDVPEGEGRPLRAQLGLLDRPAIVTGLLIALIWFGGYKVLYTYLSPYLVGTPGLESAAVIAVPFLFGLASMIDTQLGGRLADSSGYRAALIVTKFVHIAALAVLLLVSAMVGFAVAVLMVWSLVAWGRPRVSSSGSSPSIRTMPTPSSG